MNNLWVVEIHIRAIANKTWYTIDTLRLYVMANTTDDVVDWITLYMGEFGLRNKIWEIDSIKKLCLDP